jgi:hypothetical protein
VPALGEDQSGPLGPAEERHEDGGALAAVSLQGGGLARVQKAPREAGAAPPVGAQMIT